jgi:hypothetical protein
MNEKVKIKQALRVLNIIINDSQRTANAYRLNGLSAYLNFDGYTATIRNNYVIRSCTRWSTWYNSID